MAQNISFYGDLEKEVSHYWYLGGGVKACKSWGKEAIFYPRYHGTAEVTGKDSFFMDQGKDAENRKDMSFYIVLPVQR